MMKNFNYWEQKEQVERFAALEPDLRLLEILKSYKSPKKTKILDIGCAGGRNTNALAEKGFDFYAIDSSHAMINKTRERVSKYVGSKKAKEKVTINFIDDLSIFPSETFNFIIAIGIYQNAKNILNWKKTINETKRVLKRGGKLYVSIISPKSSLNGKELLPVKNMINMYIGKRSEKMFLLTAEEFENQMTLFGFLQVVPTIITKRKKMNKIQIMIYSMYQKL